MAQGGMGILQAGVMGFFLTAKTIKGGVMGCWRLIKLICEALTEEVTDPNASRLERIFNHKRLITQHFVIGGTPGKSSKEKLQEAGYQIAQGVGSLAPYYGLGSAFFAALGRSSLALLAAGASLGVGLFAILLHAYRQVRDGRVTGVIYRAPTPRQMEEGNADEPQQIRPEQVTVEVVNETSPRRPRSPKSNGKVTGQINREPTKTGDKK
jgi:hypothetical protein